MASKAAPPPIPEEHKGKSAPPPPPASTRPKSVKQTPPPAPPRLAEAGVAGVTVSRVNSGRAPPPTPNMADREDARHKSLQAKPPDSPREVEDLDALAGPKPPLIKRKLQEYRRKIIECQKSKHALERALICAVAVGLLWLTCLGLCQAIVNAFIKGPGVDKVVQYASESMARSAEVKALYDICAERLTTGCQAQLEDKIEKEKARIAYLQAETRKNLSRYYDIRDSCAGEVDFATRILDNIQESLSPVELTDEYPTSITDTDPRCLLIDEMLKGARGGIQALSTTDRYVRTADTEVDETLTAYEKRRNYDIEYVVNKTIEHANLGNGTLAQLVRNTTAYFTDVNSTYDLYLACTAPSMTYNGVVCPSASVLAQAEQMHQRALERYQRMEERVRNWESRARATMDQVNSFYQALKNNPLLRAAIDVVLFLQGLPSLEGMGFNALYGLVLGDIDFFGMFMNPTPQQMFADFEAKSKAYAESIAIQAQVSAQKQAELLAASLSFGATGLPPYDPPDINTTQRREAWEEKTGPMLKQMSEALDATAAAGSDVYATYVADGNTTNPKDIASTYLSNMVRRLFGFYVYEDVTFEDVHNSWNRVVSTALAFDYAWRALRTIQLIRKYWRVSAIDLPPADVRTDHMQNKGLAYGHQNTGQRIFMLLAHPATAVLVMFAMCVAIAILLIALYLPLYRNFLRGCVDDGVLTQTENSTYVSGPGTMVSNNAYSISWAYSTSSGDRDTTIGVDRLNARRQVVCDTEEDKSRQIFEEDEREYNFIWRSHDDLRYQAFSMKECLDIDQIQAVHSSVPGTVTGGLITDIDKVVPGGNCSTQLLPIKPAIFDCRDITCSETLCSVRDSVPQEIKLLTWRASCGAEWHIHSTLIGIILVSVVFISLNVSRICIMRGLVRVFWRYLSNGKFSYLGTCERDGELRYPKIITEEGYSMKRAIRESLAVRLKWWESKAFGIVIFSLMINVPWICLLIYFGLTLQGGALDRMLAVSE